VEGGGRTEDGALTPIVNQLKHVSSKKAVYMARRKAKVEPTPEQIQYTATIETLRTFRVLFDARRTRISQMGTVDYWLRPVLSALTKRRTQYANAGKKGFF
jgi:hypothetical protein